jgi:DNA-binding response OmpR family regulator
MHSVEASPRVLVVEDDLDLLALISEALTAEGLECVCAESEAAAYRELERAPQSFRALIADADLGRGGGSGFDVARQARFRCPALAVVYLSGQVADEVGRFGVWGAELVRKPFAARDLVTTVRKLIERDAT